MKRLRWITVPKTKEVEEALEYDKASRDDLLELILKEKDFIELWDAEIFSSINSLCNVIIDDFEEEEITNSLCIVKVIDFLTKKILETDGNLNKNLMALRILFQEALGRNTGVYFFF